MNQNRKFSYTKTSRELEQQLPDKVAAIPAVSEKVPTEGLLPIGGYSKTDGTLPVNLFCVISGGTTRERAFLNELESKNTFSKVRVIFVSSAKDEGGLTPKMMNDIYAKMRGEGVIHTKSGDIIIDAIDKFYMFTDVDHYEQELTDILSSQDNKSQPIWAISNPDFEIWIYYCYRNNPQTELVDIVNTTPSSRSSLLKTINGTFNNGGGLDPRKAFELIKDGVANSKAHYSADGNGIPALLCTNMFIFAEDMLICVGDEYDRWKDKLKEWRKRMKK